MTKKRIAFYTASNIDTCPWPLTEEGAYAKKFLEPLVKEGVHRFVNNIDTEMGILIVGDLSLPVTINDAQYDNSFVCSPFGHYVSYSSIVLDNLKNPLLKSTAGFFLKIYESFMKRGKINRVVIVNNWLFTTNPSPKIDPATLKTINDYLQDKFPDRAIIFRSITKKTCSECYDALNKTGYHLIASRYMYILDGSNESVFHTRIFKSDLKHFRERDLILSNHSDIKESDIPKLQELYHALYIQKYSKLNPQFNQRFFRHLLKNELLQIFAAKDAEGYVGVVGYFCRDKQMISPLFGYNPALDIKGVYRFLSTILLLEAQKQKAVFNQSAGGSFYKKIRRAEGEMEYTAVYMKHLPFHRKIPWWILKLVINSLGKMYMKQY